MIRAAIVGMGWWGRTLVEAVQAESDQIRFVAGATRTVSPEVQAFSEAQHLRLVDSYEGLLSDKSIDAVVLTPQPPARSLASTEHRTNPRPSLQAASLSAPDALNARPDG